MQKKLTDEQLDNLLRMVMADVAADEETINEVAASPTVWWGVQRRINQQKEDARAPWPPVSKIWRWLLIGVPAAAAAVLAITTFLVPPTEIPAVDQAAVSNIPVLQGTAENEYAILSTGPGISSDKPDGSYISPNSHRPKTKSRRTVKKSIASRQAHREDAKKEEVKSEFIALSYARDPESGQIVRVKVPSSMMVMVGLVASVEKPSAMIDAEVIVGDDGLTRAIRFIH